MVLSFLRKKRGQPLDHRDINALQAATETLDGSLTTAQGNIASNSSAITTLQGQVAAISAAPTSRLAYTAPADLANGAALTTGVWTDLVPNQSFTLGSTGSWLAINIRLSGLLICSSGIAEYAFRAMFDSNASLVMLFAGGITPSGQYGPMLGGQLYLPPSYFAASGSHTIKLQIVTGSAGTSIYLRPSSAGTFEQAAIRILELHQ